MGDLWEKAGGGEVENSPGGYGSHVCTNDGGFCKAGEEESWEVLTASDTRLAMVVVGGNGRGFFFSLEGLVGRFDGYLALGFTYVKSLLKTVYHSSSLH